MFLTGARRGDLVTSMDLVTFGVFILLENHGCATLCVSLLRVFAYHESFLRLGATDLGCVGDFLTVEPLWLHHRTVFFFAVCHILEHTCTVHPIGRLRFCGLVSRAGQWNCFGFIRGLVFSQFATIVDAPVHGISFDIIGLLLRR